MDIIALLLYLTGFVLFFYFFGVQVSKPTVASTLRLLGMSTVWFVFAWAYVIRISRIKE